MDSMKKKITEAAGNLNGNMRFLRLLEGQVPEMIELEKNATILYYIYTFVPCFYKFCQ